MAQGRVRSLDVTLLLVVNIDKERSPGGLGGDPPPPIALTPRSLGSPRGSQDGPWAVLGRLGPSWGRLGPSWGRLGVVLRPSWGLLGSLGPILGPPGALWEPLGGVPNRSKNRSENRSELVPDPGGPKSLWTYVSRCPRHLGDSPGLTWTHRKSNRVTVQNYQTGYPYD